MSDIATRADIAVSKIIDDLTDRRGLRHEWDNIDSDVVAEIMETWRKIIEKAFEP